jgi:hypothetical protein
MMNTDKNKNDQQKQDKKHDEKVERITQPTAKKDPENQVPRSDEHEQAGRSMGNEPRSGGRQGGKSVEDGGDDIGSSAGSR